MAELQILTNFKSHINEVQSLLEKYQTNLRNEIFETNEDETDEHAYKRGEGIFDQIDENVRNINKIIHKEQDILTFFSLCKSNKEKLIDYKNELINKLLRIKKNCSRTDEWLNCRDEWNRKREEAPDVKNRRECEEMLEEIKEEKKIVKEMTKNLLKEKKELEFLIGYIKTNNIKPENNEIGNNNVVNNNDNNNMMTKKRKTMDIVNTDLKNESLLKDIKPTNQNNETEQNEKFIQTLRKNPNIGQTKHDRTTSELSVKQKMRNLGDQAKQKINLKDDIEGIKYNLSKDQMKQLEQWTKLKCSEIVFDSNTDNCFTHTSVFNDKIIGKRHLMFVIENDDNMKFGYYYNPKIIEKYDEWTAADDKSFIFNIESNGRLNGMMKFEITDKRFGYYLYSKSDKWLLRLEDILLRKRNTFNQCRCLQNVCFNDQGESFSMFDKSPNENGVITFGLKRFIVIQMK